MLKEIIPGYYKYKDADDDGTFLDDDVVEEYDDDYYDDDFFKDEVFISLNLSRCCITDLVD